MWFFMNLGEVKGAESLKGMTSLTVGSLWLAAVFMIIWGHELVQMVGRDFLGAAGFTFYSGTLLFPIPPFYTNLVSALAVAPAALIGLGTLPIGLGERRP